MLFRSYKILLCFYLLSEIVFAGGFSLCARSAASPIDRLSCSGTSIPIFVSCRLGRASLFRFLWIRVPLPLYADASLGNSPFAMRFRAFEPVLMVLIARHYSLQAADLREAAAMYKELPYHIEAKDEDAAADCVCGTDSCPGRQCAGAKTHTRQTIPRTHRLPVCSLFSLRFVSRFW